MAGFFDKVVVGLNKGVNTVSEGYEFIVERANLNTKIKEAESEKARLLQNLGALVYNLHANGEIEIEQCAGLCSEVTTADNNLCELQQQLQKLEASKNQGNQQPQVTQTVTAQQPVTSGVQCECGHTNSQNAKFCAKCGKPLAN